jgi:hypothetical protein
LISNLIHHAKRRLVVTSDSYERPMTRGKLK